MRALMVTPSYFPIVGGAEAVVRSLSTRLNEKGIHTDIMTFNMNQKWHPAWKGKTEKIDDVNVFKIPALNLLPQRAHSNRITLRINLIPGRFLNRLSDYDIIHFHDGDDLSFPLLSYFVKKPKILHLHGFSIDFYQRYFLSRCIFKNVACLYISPSQVIVNRLAELGIPEQKIRRLPNSVEASLFRPLGEKEDNLILFVGRINRFKGLHILLKALQLLEKPVHLVIIGPVWDAKYFAEMSKIIENENEKGIHKITYLGEQDQTNVIRWCQKASIFVLPSLGEAFPVVNLEALSCETPVVATDVGATSEVVRDGENGMLVPPNDAVKLAEAIQYLLENKDVRTSFGREGRKWVQKNFSLETVTEKLCGIYKEMC
jgi:glycosyltransferase involved in cell wall biosynthesis